MNSFSRGKTSLFLFLTLSFILPSLAQAGVVSSPGPQGLGEVKQIATAEGVSCAVRTDNSLRCWGRGTSDQEKVPSGLGTVKDVSLNYWGACAVRVDNLLRCWGQHPSGDPAPRVPGDLGTVLDVEVGNSNICVIKTDNQVRCWAQGGGIGVPISSPQGIGEVKQISVGVGAACALKTDNQVRCWGDKGDLSSKVPAGLPAALEVSNNDERACMIGQDHLLRCWGKSRPGPSNMGLVDHISLGWGNLCVIKSGQDLHCWYDSSWYGGGLPVPPGLGAIKMVAGQNGNNACAIRSDDHLMCWGGDWAGQVTGRPGLDVDDMVGPPRLRGRTMSVSSSYWKWSNGPILTRVYKWRRMKHADFLRGYVRWQDIPGTDSLSYTAKPGDNGYNIQACSQATNLDGVSDWECSVMRGPFRK